MIEIEIGRRLGVIIIIVMALWVMYKIMELPQHERARKKDTNM